MDDNDKVNGEANGRLVPMHIQWHKICALLIFKMGGSQTITPQDIIELEKKFPNGAVFVRDLEDGLHLDMVTHEHAVQLAEDQEDKDKKPGLISGESNRSIGSIGNGSTGL
jgi:hypothetical protein